MSELYFKVGSDWSEVVRLRQEIARLENQLNRFNGRAPVDVLNKLCDELSIAKKRMQTLLDDAAIAGKQLEKSFPSTIRIDLSEPEGHLKAFDAQVMKMCINLDAYFSGLKQKLTELNSVLDAGQAIASNIHVTDENSQRIEQIKHQNAELQEQIKQQTAEIERQQTQWQRLADAVRSNNVPAVKQLSQQTDEATRRLRMDAAKGSINGIKAELDQLADSMAIVEGDADSLKAKLDDLRNRQAAGDTSVTDAMIAETEALYHKASDELASMKEEYNSMTVEQKKYIDQLKEANGHHARLRTEIMDTREQMARLIAEGQADTPAFRQLAEQAGDMRRQMALANATMQYFANPTRHLEGLKTALQGVTGAASLATGVLGVFNTNSEKMAAIQTKIQSYLGIIVGLESTYATVKKTSNAMLLISEVRTMALAKAKAYETIATNAGTIAIMKAAAAQAFFNAIAKANPYLLLVTGIGLVCGAIWGLTKALNAESEEEERLQKEREERIRASRESHEKWANAVASSVGKQMASYANLKRKWNELGDDMNAKKKFIDDNKDAFHDLGWAVNGVADAESLFTKNTQAVVDAMIARAKAAAYQTAIADEYAKSIKKRDQIDNTVAGGGYRRVFKEGERLTNDQIKALNGQYGINLSATSLDPRTQIKGVSFSTDSKLTAASAAYLTSLEAKDATKRWKANVDALNRETEERVGYLTKGLEDAVKKQEQAVKAVGVEEWRGNGNDVRSVKGKSPDDILRMQIKQEQDEASQRQQNLLLQEQAVIDQMDDGTEKELAQMRLNHRKRMQELDNEQQDILNKKIEAASKNAKGEAIKGFYSSGQYKNVQLTDDDMLGVNSQRVSETEAYADKLAELFKKITTSSDSAEKRMELMRKAYDDFVADINNTPLTATDDGQVGAAQKILDDIQKLYQKSQDELYREQLSHLYDYLREFGTIQEQIYAIEKQYNDKIAAEKDENIKRQLQKQKEAAMAGMNAQNLAMNIDWSTAFNGVGNVLKDIAKETLAKVEEYMSRDEFKKLNAKDKQSYVELRDQLRKETGGNSTSAFNFKIWGVIEQNVKDYQASIEKLKAAQEAHNAAIQDMKDADAQYTEAVRSGSDDMKQAAKDVLEAAQDAVNVTGKDQENAKAESDKAKRALTDNTNAAAKGIQNFASYLNEMSNGSLYGFANGITKLITSLGKGSDGIGKALGELGGKIGGLIGAILQILDALGNDPAQFIQDLLHRVSDVVEAVLSTVLTEIVPAVLEGVVDIIGAVIDGIGKLVTFGEWDSIFGDHEKEYKDGLKSWEQKIVANTYAVEQLTKSMTDKTKTPQEAQDRRNEALLALQGEIASKRGTANYIADDSSSNIFKGYHSWYYMRNSEAFDYNKFNNVLAEHGSNARVYNAQSVLGLSPEDIQILRTYAGADWASYFGDIGSKQNPNDIKQYLEQIGDLAEKDKEIMGEWYASLTNMTFESLRDNFKSMLKDLSKDRDAFLDDFSDKMMDSLLDTMMSTSGLSQRLKDWQEKWGDYIASGNKLSEEEVRALREEYQRLINEGIALRDEVARVTGYDQTQDKRQEADKKGFAAMSQDTGEELNGRFTAVQIAGEKVSAQMNIAVPILTGIGASASRTADMVEGLGRVADEMLTNVVECYTELNLIRVNTEELVEMGKKHTASLQMIADGIKHL